MMADVDTLAGIARDLVGQLYDARLRIIHERSCDWDTDTFKLALECAEVMGQIDEAANPTDPGTPYGHEDICRECGDLRANCTGDTVDTVDDPEEEEEENTMKNDDWQPGMPTPGPWMVDINTEAPSREQVLVITKDQSIAVAALWMENVDNNVEAVLPDAYLMAAAPEMRAMLEEVRQFCPVSVQDRISALLTRIGEQENP